jgi:ribosomal-protein-alanine N-acetyltransferase
VPFTRLVQRDDAAAIAEILNRNREFMAPTEPDRDESFYTVEGQSQIIGVALTEHQAGIRLPHVILDDDGSVVGRATLNEIVRGPLQSASLGYYVDGRRNGRGLASRATAEMVSIAFGELGLHRVQAGTQPENLASQRVLIKNSFRQYGYAPEYLKLAGEWRDGLLYQRLATDLVDEQAMDYPRTAISLP